VNLPAPRRWSLQTRLIATVVSLVAFILAAIGLTTATALGAIVAGSLDSEIRVAASQIPIIPGNSAFTTLQLGRQQPGTLLVLESFTTTSGAYVAPNGSVRELRADQVDNILDTIAHGGFSTVAIPGFGEYRVTTSAYPAGSFVLGLSAASQASTIGEILATIVAVTLCGLVLLALVIALVIRHSLRPLAAVADTAERVARMPLSEGAVTIAERVPTDEADPTSEIGRVGAALNTLLDHVDASLGARQRNEERMRAFVADASHELRTPLASIRGYSELSLRSLRQSPDSPATVPQTTEALDRIQAQSLRMQALVEDLLLLARLDEGQELAYGAVDLSLLAVECVADARPAGRDHEWRVDVGEDPVVVAGDAARLRQVVVNLLANARVHTPAGTVVTTSVSRDGTWAVLRVHDDGPGIDPAIADRLFERFARADSSRARQTGGTGLGLSIAKAIVDGHRGTIRVDSRPGSTTFEVRVPARPADPRAVAAAP
jgi:two-component system OmpR family sensor kinase